MREEKIVVGEGGQYPLDGMLTLPDHINAPIPGVVLVHGSGATNMDETVSRNSPFRDIAEYLPTKGIAVLRYDKRAFAYKKETKKNIKNITIRNETIEDAVLAADLMREDPRIGSVYIAGHSLGGMMAPRIDAEGGNFDGLIVMAGSPRTLWEIMQDQFEDIIAAYKGPMKALAKKQYKTLAENMKDRFNLTDEEARKKKALGMMRVYYFKEMEEHPNFEYLRKNQKPMLILQGEKDFQVSADKDFKLYQEILKEHPDVTYNLYPDLNHMFMPSVTGTVKEYKIAAKVDKGVLDDISRWILQQVVV